MSTFQQPEHNQDLDVLFCADDEQDVDQGIPGSNSYGAWNDAIEIEDQSSSTK